MATFKTITIKESAYRVLKKYKSRGDSFSDVIEREFGGRIDTADDLLALIKRHTGRGFGFRASKRKGKAA
jgi:predicted CopG family antitoxin